VAAGASLQGRIKIAAAKGHGAQIVIADLTDFPWTTLHVFDPYSPGEWNLTALGCTPEDPDVLDMSDEEGSALLVFRGDRLRRACGEDQPPRQRLRGRWSAGTGRDLARRRALHRAR
jgi:hypothetical protein